MSKCANPSVHWQDIEWEELQSYPYPSLCKPGDLPGPEPVVLRFCKGTSIDLSSGYLFRPTSPHGSVVDAPLVTLVTYLLKLGIFERESSHSFRSGAVIMLRLLGISWQSTQIEKVTGMSSSDRRLLQIP